MDVFILLFLFNVAICQAYLSPANGDPVATHGDSKLDPAYEESKEQAIPGVYKPSFRSLKPDTRSPVRHVKSRSYIINPVHQYRNPNPDRFQNVHQMINPSAHTRSLINESYRLRQVAQAEREAQLQQRGIIEYENRLAAVDQEALSNIPEDFRNIIQRELSLAEREDLLAKLETGQLDDLLPYQENRFGDFSISGAAAQIGASAGGYIGRKLAGTLGAKLGAAAGAYLGAAAASRLVKKRTGVPNFLQGGGTLNAQAPSNAQYGPSYGGSDAEASSNAQFGTNNGGSVAQASSNAQFGNSYGGSGAEASTNAQFGNGFGGSGAEASSNAHFGNSYSGSGAETLSNAQFGASNGNFGAFLMSSK